MSEVGSLSEYEQPEGPQSSGQHSDVEPSGDRAMFKFGKSTKTIIVMGFSRFSLNIWLHMVFSEIISPHKFFALLPSSNLAPGDQQSENHQLEDHQPAEEQLGRQSENELSKE